MPIPTFTAGYPPDKTTLGQTKTQIRNNIDGTFQTLAINHFDNNNTNAGKHKYIQLIEGHPGGMTAPLELLLFGGTLPGAGNLNLCYNKQSTTIGGGVNQSVQLTREEYPITIGNNGFSWIAGNILIQWGQTTKTNGNTISFPTAFSSAPFSVVATIIDTTNRQFIYTNTYTTTTFKVALLNSGGAGESATFSWIAIGQ